jgi:hypothetical protein
LEHAGADLRADRGIVIEAVRVDAGALVFASAALRADFEVQEVAGLTKPDPSVKRRRVHVDTATPELLAPQNRPSVSGAQGEDEDVAASRHHPPVAARPQFRIVGTGDDPIVDRCIPWATLVNYVTEIPPRRIPPRRITPKVMPRPALQRHPSDVYTCQAPPRDDDAEEVAPLYPVQQSPLDDVHDYPDSDGEDLVSNPE